MIQIEHVIAEVNRSRIVKDLFRNTRIAYDALVMEVACGLHNFRTKCRYWGSSDTDSLISDIVVARIEGTDAKPQIDCKKG